MAVSLGVFEIFGDKMARPWNRWYGSFKLLKMAEFGIYYLLLVCRCKYSSDSYHFQVIWIWVMSWP